MNHDIIFYEGVGPRNALCLGPGEFRYPPQAGDMYKMMMRFREATMGNETGQDILIIYRDDEFGSIVTPSDCDDVCIPILWGHGDHSIQGNIVNDTKQRPRVNIHKTFVGQQIVRSTNLCIPNHTMIEWYNIRYAYM